MANEITIGFLIFGGFIGAIILSLFPYFQRKNAWETEIQAIKEKPESERTDAEKFKLTVTPQTFWQEYKYRFTFGLITGIGASLAAIQGLIGGINESTTAFSAFFSGLTASGFFTALASAVRANGTSPAPT